MKTLIIIVVSTVLFSSLSGCVIVAGDRDDWNNSDWASEQRENRQKISNLELRSSRQSVVDKLGSANFSDAYMKGEDEFRVLYYRTQHIESDGETSKDETTPLVFMNDKLIGWGVDVLAANR